MAETSAMPAREVVAFNDAVDSGNPMHEDETARSLGFKGALVPGVTVYGYATHGVLEHFGPAWLERGNMAVKFLQPVYDGERTRIETTVEAASDAQDVVQVRVLNPDGDTCVVATASIDAAGTVVPGIAAGPIAPARPLPVPKWPAIRERFASERVLGSWRAAFPATAAATYLHDLHEDHPVYADGVVHPAWLLRQANLVVDRNFSLGPWIHVGSEIRHFGLLRHDETVELRAQVVNLYDRKGRDYCDLDVAYVVPDEPGRIVLRVLHRAIYNLH